MNGACQQCLNDSDCSSAVCNSNNGTCVECKCRIYIYINISNLTIFSSSTC